MNNKIIIVVAGVLVLVGGGAFVMSRNNSNSENMDMNFETRATATPISPLSDDIKTIRTINIEAGSFYYNPKEIRAKKGETLKIVMTSKDMMHDFVIDDLNVKLPITKAGDTNEVTFTVDKAGTFEYYCGVGNHRKMGQVGKLIVE